MIKILIVEDEPEKKRLLVETILSVDSLGHDNISYAPDVRSAKKAIKETRFELIILDINIPSNPDEASSVGAGLGVLSFIKNNAAAKAPGFIVGMSAHDDGMHAAEKEFSSPLWKLVHFSYTDTSWQAPLKEALRYLISKDLPPFISDGHTYHTDLAIFVALEDEELNSIRNLDGAWTERHIPHDSSRYFEGRFEGARGTLSVVVVAAPKMGMPTAAVVASKLISAYRPKYLAITGICAGVRGKSKLGDILIADPCFDWGSGKWIKDTSGELKFRPAPYPWRLDRNLRSYFKRLGESKEYLSQLRNRYEGWRPDSPPDVLIEAMASGGSVLQAAKLMEDVREQHKNLIGVEMESYAVFTAAEYAAEPRPICFSIKAVCDFGDENKNDGAHGFAAYASAEFLYEFSIRHLISGD
jgi:nucleoside phosphorylase/CheY-like chemotaxis protein